MENHRDGARDSLEQVRLFSMTSCCVSFGLVSHTVVSLALCGRTVPLCAVCSCALTSSRWCATWRPASKCWPRWYAWRPVAVSDLWRVLWLTVSGTRAVVVQKSAQEAHQSTVASLTADIVALQSELNSELTSQVQAHAMRERGAYSSW